MDTDVSNDTPRTIPPEHRRAIERYIARRLREDYVDGDEVLLCEAGRVPAHFVRDFADALEHEGLEAALKVE